MEDVGRAPADASPVLNLEPTTIPTLDGWIESLMGCKQLAESDVQRLCDKVSRPPGSGTREGCCWTRWARQLSRRRRWVVLFADPGRRARASLA